MLLSGNQSSLSIEDTRQFQQEAHVLHLLPWTVLQFRQKHENAARHPDSVRSFQSCDRGLRKASLSNAK